MQLPFVVAGTGVDPAGAVLVELGPTQSVRIGIEHRVERLFDHQAHRLPKVLPDQTLIDLDDLTPGVGRLRAGAAGLPTTVGVAISSDMSAGSSG